MTPSSNRHLTSEEKSLIAKIAERSSKLRATPPQNVVQTGIDNFQRILDLTACHTGRCPLLLEKLLSASYDDFVHDVWGIGSNIDRRTGALKNHFRPRFAAQSKYYARRR
jgi:hypothetical protein